MKHKVRLLIVSSVLVMALLLSVNPFLFYVRAEVSPFFFDDFESHSIGIKPEGYYCEQSADGLTKTVVSNTVSKDGIQAMLISDMSDNYDDGRALLSRQFTPVTTLTVEFDYYPVSANVNAIGVFYGGTASTNGMFSIYLYPNGELKYYNGSSGSLGVTLDFNQWYAIRFEASIAEGLNLYIDEVYVGNIATRAGFTAMDRVVFQGNGAVQTGDEYYIDNLTFTSLDIPTANPPIFLDTFEDDNLGTLPARYSVPSFNDVTYESLPSLNGYLNYDITPETGVVTDWGYSDGNSLDHRNTSLVVDLGSSIEIDAVRFINNFTTTRVNESNTKLYKSDDNTTYTEIPFELDIYMEDGKCMLRFRFEDVTARYIKVNSLFSDTSYTLNLVKMQEDFIAERIEASWYYESIPKVDGYLNFDTTPLTGQIGSWGYTGANSLDHRNTSLGIDLGSTMTVDAIRFNSSNDATRVDASNTKIYKSEDNVTYTEIPFDLDAYMVNGLSVLRFQFEGETGRYFKVNSLFSDLSYTLRMNSVAADIIAERKTPVLPTQGYAAVTSDIAFESQQSLEINSEDRGIDVTSSFDTTTATKLSFQLYLDSLSGDFRFGFSNGSSKVIELKLDKDGALYFARAGRWVPIAETGVIKTGQWNVFTANVPQTEYKIELADIFVNGVFIGSAYYNNVSAGVDSIHFGVDGAKVYIDNVEMSTSDPACRLPNYDAKDVAVYKPEVIPSVNGYLEYDTNPTDGTLGDWDATGGVALDWKNTSVGVDLGYTQKVNAIRVFGRDATAAPKQEDYQLYYSDNNIDYYSVPGFLFNSYIENGRCVHLFEFSGIKARYIKVHSLFSGISNYTFAVWEQQNDIRAERWMNKEYRLPSTSALFENDVNPATGTLIPVYQSGVPFALTDSASAGLDLGIITDVDAVEIWEAGTEPSAVPQDFEIYYAGGDGEYKRIDKVINGTRVEDDRMVYRFSFDSVHAKWIKVRAASTRSFAVQDIQSDIRAYSAVETASYFNNSFSPKRGGEGDFSVKNDGTLLMTFNAFEGLDDFAEAALGARESIDGGYTWDDEYIMLPNEGFYNIMNGSILRMENGDLGLFYMVKEEGEIANLYVRRSEDDGATWGSRMLITTVPQGYTIQSSGNRVLRLSTGRILLPVSWSELVSDVYGGVHTYAMIWYSDNDGYTWQRAPGRVNLPNGTLEPTLAELPSGEVFMSLRTRDSNSMYKAISADEGLRWSIPEKYSMNSAGSTTTVSTVPATGDLLLSWNNAVGTGNNPRNPLSIALSSDGGQSWQVDRNIFEGRVQSSNDFAFPVIAFYGRAVYFQFAATSGYTTALRIMDIDMLYHMVRSSVSVSDLSKAPTPSAVYDPETMILTGLSMDMVYSLDDGQSWKFAGGDTLYFNTDDIEMNILVRDNGGYSHAPSDIQTISTYIPVDSIKLNKDKAIIVKGETDLLIKEVLPENATNQFVIWESDDSDVATVDSTGLVRAVGIGNATITATTLDGEHTAICEVMVVEAMISVTDIIPGNNQTNVEFPIVSADGKGYSVYLSSTGEDGSFEIYTNVNYNVNGVHIRGLTNDITYYIYIEYKQNGDVLFISNPIDIRSTKNLLIAQFSE